MTILERGEGFSVANVGILSLLMVLIESIPFVLELLSAHQPVLGGFEADEAKLLLQLHSPELLQYRIRNTPPTASERLEAFLFWKWRRGH